MVRLNRILYHREPGQLSIPVVKSTEFQQKKRLVKERSQDTAATDECQQFNLEHLLPFDKPQTINRIQRIFAQNELVCTPQFALCWYGDGRNSRQKIVRRQYNYSLPDSVRELKDYRVDLNTVTALEQRTTPDINGEHTHASLAQLRIE